MTKENEQTENVEMRKAFAAQNPVKKDNKDYGKPPKIDGTAEELVRSLNPYGQKDCG